MPQNIGIRNVLGPEQGPSVLDSPMERLIRSMLAGQRPEDQIMPMPMAMASPLNPVAGSSAGAAKEGLQRLMQRIFPYPAPQQTWGNASSRVPQAARMQFLQRHLGLPPQAISGRSPRTPGQLVGLMSGADKAVGAGGYADGGNLQRLIQALSNDAAKFGFPKTR